MMDVVVVTGSHSKHIGRNQTWARLHGDSIRACLRTRHSCDVSLFPLSRASPLRPFVHFFLVCDGSGSRRTNRRTSLSPLRGSRAHHASHSLAAAHPSVKPGKSEPSLLLDEKPLSGWLPARPPHSLSVEPRRFYLQSRPPRFPDQE